MTETYPQARLPPSHWWHYAICMGGPLDGQVKEVPSFALEGRIVTFNEGNYMIGPLVEGTRVRYVMWWD